MSDEAELRAENERLRAQWEEHCAYHGSESPHALGDALYRASDAESAAKSLAEDRFNLRSAVTKLEQERDAAEARLATAEGLWTYWRDNDITDDDDRWAEFTNAVYAFLDGKPVPDRFLAGQPAVSLDADQVAKACCDIARRNGWVLTYRLERASQPAAPAYTTGDVEKDIRVAQALGEAVTGGQAVAQSEETCRCADDLLEEPCPVHGMLFSPTDAEADALGLPRCPAAPARTEAELDSPPFKTEALTELEAREFKRINRKPTRTEAEPDLYDPRTRTVLAHPAQKLAVQAFARERTEAEQNLATAEMEREALYCSPIERAVLDGMASEDIHHLLWCVKNLVNLKGLREASKAELTRRRLGR